MKKIIAAAFILHALCCALGMVLYAGAAHAAFWQVVRDTPVLEAPAAAARVLDTARKGWIMNGMVREGSGPQWIAVVELQKRIGDGMAYAHLIYHTPGEPVYINAADVVQVADQNGTPLKSGGGVSAASATAAATVAEGVRVELLPAPRMTDLVSNGAVDEAALKQGLETWVQVCNAVLAEYPNMDTDAAVQKILNWSYDTFSQGYSSVEASVTPLLERWLMHKYGGDEPRPELGAGDRKILEVLASYGLVPAMGEGTPYLEADLPFLRKRVALGGQAGDYMALLDSQPQRLYTDGGCRYSVKKMGNWAMQWEAYLKDVPVSSPCFTAGKMRYRDFMAHILLSTLPNTPAFPRSNKGRMEKAWMADLESLVRENPDTETAALIADFLKRIKANGNKLSASVEKQVLTRLDAIFVSRPAASPAKANAKPAALSPAE